MTAGLPRCQIVPLADHQVAFQISGRERLRWHFGPNYPRPFFFPFVGPGGESLTRMGHPGAPDHDHHQSIWFAHHRVLGIDFWSNQSSARIRQLSWLAYVDGDDEAVMACQLGWFDGHDPQPLLYQELVAALRWTESDETQLELQATFRPVAESLEFGQTNFGFLAVRVAKSLSAHFGGGMLTDSEGRQGEPAIFAQRAQWMDYRGPCRGKDRPEAITTAGITFFDHPQNPGHPTSWHVRDDGWMGAAACLAGPLTISRTQPLVLRYLLHGSEGTFDRSHTAARWAEFAARPAFVVEKATVKHQAWQVRRAT